MNNMMNILGKLRANPASFLGNLQGVDMTNPNAIIQHLMNTGRVSQAQYNQAIQQAKMMGFKK